jgi:Cu(I)/Ag(I) efflux system protein CusF
MNKKIYCLTLGMIITLTTTVFGHKEVKHTKKHSTDHSDKVSEQKWTEGIVRRIDSAEEKITIKHGEIKNIGMPPMTMTFQVKDSVLLHDLKLRDEIRFQVTDLGEGEFRVEALEIIKPYSKDNHSQKIISSKSEEIKNVSSQSDIKEKENLINESHKVMEGSSEDELKKPPHNDHFAVQKIDKPDLLSAWVGLDAFPTLHPLVVHLPVVLLPFALLLLTLELISRQKKRQLPVIISAIGGTLGALLASYLLHPHVESMSKEAFEVLEAHDLFAYMTTGFASSACIFLLARFFRWNNKDRKWWTILSFILLLSSSLSVAATGHLGATLSHVHEVEISKMDH